MKYVSDLKSLKLFFNNFDIKTELQLVTLSTVCSPKHVAVV